MAAVLQVSQVHLFTPAAPRLDVSQVHLQVPSPPDPGSAAVLRVAQVKLAAPSPAAPVVLQVSQVRLKAPMPAGEAPYSGIRIASGSNLHNASIRIAANGEL